MARIKEDKIIKRPRWRFFHNQNSLSHKNAIKLAIIKKRLCDVGLDFIAKDEDSIIRAALDLFERSLDGFHEVKDGKHL